MQSQFIDSWTPFERAVAVEICNRGGAEIADIDAVEGVRASGPLHEHRRRRRPGVLDVIEEAIIEEAIIFPCRSPFSHHEVQVTCGRHKTMRSQHIDRRTRFVPSPSISENAGVLSQPTRMPSKGFLLPVLSTNAGAVDVPMFSK